VLLIIVAIPLPMTWAWTGSVASCLFGIPVKKSVSIIGLGVAIAGIVTTILTLVGIQIS